MTHGISSLFLLLVAACGSASNPERESPPENATTVDEPSVCPPLLPRGPLEPAEGAVASLPLSIARGETPASLPDALFVDSASPDYALSHLRAFGEPDLSGAELDTLVLRLMYLRSFHEPVLVRVERTAEGAIALVKRLTGRRGWTDACVVDGVHILRAPGCHWIPGELDVLGARRLDEAELATLVARMGALEPVPVAEAPTPTPPADPDVRVIQLEQLCLDGSQWYVEGIDERGYRARRGDCQIDDGLQELGCALLGSAGVDFGRVY